MPERITDEQLQEICDRTLDDLYEQVSRRCGGHRELAEDITQEAWLRAVRDWRQRGAPTNALAWLATVARNLLVDHHRGRLHVPIDTVSPSEVLAAVEENAVSDSSETAALVNRALLQLSSADAGMLEAFHFEHSKMSELASRFGISERAVEGRLRRARERLKLKLIQLMPVNRERP